MLALFLLFYSLPKWRRFWGGALAILLSRSLDIASTLAWVDPRAEANPLWQSGWLVYASTLCVSAGTAFALAFRMEYAQAVIQSRGPLP